MVVARWNGAIIAQSDDTVVVEGNHYFPRDSVNVDFLQGSDKTSVCGWKGTAHYHSLIVDGNARSEALARRMGCQFEGEFTHETFGKSRIFRHPATPA